jgi:hypothetical protein
MWAPETSITPLLRFQIIKSMLTMKYRNLILCPNFRSLDFPVLQLLPPKTHPGPTEPAITLEEPNYHTLNLKDNDLDEAPCKSLGGLLPKCENVSIGICADTVIALILTISVTVLMYYLGGETSILLQKIPSVSRCTHHTEMTVLTWELIFFNFRVNTTFKPEFQWFGPQGEVFYTRKFAQECHTWKQ